MKRHVIISLALLALSLCVSAQDKESESSLNEVRKQAMERQAKHLLDGTSFKYYYTNGGGIQIQFHDGMLKYEWITGPRTGNKNKDLPYTSRKIGDKMYLISWLEASHPDYTTLVFNFHNNVMYSSGIFRFGTENQFTRFDAGIIEDLVLVEQ